MPDKKLATVTLGCKVNQYDTDSVITQFLEAGYKVVDFHEVADIYLINTCTVTNLGDRKSRQMIRRATKRNPQAKIVVMGCLAQTTPEEITALEGVTLVVGTQGRGRILEEIEALERGDQTSLVEDIFQITEFEDLPALDFSGRTRATLKIQDGCNQFCTYCRVPFARGRSRSRERHSVLAQVKQLVEEGFAEIVLTGIHLGLYGQDLEPSISLAQISKEIADTAGLQRLRISSVDPHEITDELLDLVVNHPVLCRHLHIPLQSGSNQVLQRMKRNYSREDFQEIVRKIRRQIPDVAITTDIMVGFPGETEEDFSQTMELAKEVAFSKIHVFQYSPREGTVAAKFSHQIEARIKEDRSKRLIELGNTLAYNFHSSFIGREVEVLVEQQGKTEGIGHTDNYLRVSFPVEQGTNLVGQIVPVRVVSGDLEGVQGALI